MCYPLQPWSTIKSHNSHNTAPKFVPVSQCIICSQNYDQSFYSILHFFTSAKTHWSIVLSTGLSICVLDDCKSNECITIQFLAHSSGEG